MRTILDRGLVGCHLLSLGPDISLGSILSLEAGPGLEDGSTTKTLLNKTSETIMLTLSTGALHGLSYSAIHESSGVRSSFDMLVLCRSFTVGVVFSIWRNRIFNSHARSWDKGF